jgi:actin beta/gamma 1
MPWIYFGGEAESSNVRGVCTFKSPIERGIVTNWDDMEKLWHHTFYNKLYVAPEECPVFITEPSLNPKANRERMTQIMFETFNVPALRVEKVAYLSLAADGCTTGCVVDSGHTVTRVVPVYQGKEIPHAIIHFNLGGRDLTDYLEKILLEQGSLPLTAEVDTENLFAKVALAKAAESQCKVVAGIKEKLAFIVANFDEANAAGFPVPAGIPSKASAGGPVSSAVSAAATAVNASSAAAGAEVAEVEAKSSEYELQNGKVVAITDGGCCRCTEPLFRPSLLVGKEGTCGLHECTFEAIMKCDAEVHTELFGHILLCGGNTMFPGMSERMTRDISRLVGDSAIPVKVVAPPWRSMLAWLGGSALGGLHVCFGEKTWIDMAAYNEHGPAIVHSICT